MELEFSLGTGLENYQDILEYIFHFIPNQPELMLVNKKWKEIYIKIIIYNRTCLKFYRIGFIGPFDYFRIKKLSIDGYLNSYPSMLEKFINLEKLEIVKVNLTFNLVKIMEKLRIKKLIIKKVMFIHNELPAITNLEFLKIKDCYGIFDSGPLKNCPNLKRVIIKNTCNDYFPENYLQKIEKYEYLKVILKK